MSDLTDEELRDHLTGLERAAATETRAYRIAAELVRRRAKRDKLLAASEGGEG